MYKLNKTDVEEIGWLLNQMPYSHSKQIKWIESIINSRYVEEKQAEKPDNKHKIK